MAIEITDEFAHALDLLNRGQNVFITGNAGTGKSTLIRYFLEHTDRNVVVAAPTGIAALNVGGYTLHRLFGYNPTTTLEDVKSGRAYPKAFSHALRNLDTLIVDEASMVRADLFDQVCESLRMWGPRKGEPLGGVQLVLVGDLYQLPPVVSDWEAPIFESDYSTPYFFSSLRYKELGFSTVNLTKVFRQIGDTKLIDMLNAIRSGRVGKNILAEFNQKCDADFLPDPGEFWITLATTNRMVNTRNNQALEALEGVLYESDAIVTGEAQDDDYPPPEKLLFKIGAQVMMLNNDQGERWANGSMGKVVSFVPGNGERGDRVVIDIRGGKRVWVAKETWEVTRPVSDGSRIRHEVVGTAKQFPFKLAWALTIHKSQGQTLDRAIIDLTGGTFTTGQLYVALSRSTNFDGIVLRRPICAKDIKVDMRVRQFLDETTGQSATRFAYLGMTLVGQGDGYLRPIALAVVTPHEDGQLSVFETLINPTRDIGEAATKYQISASDLQAAPRLDQVWPEVEKLIDGRGVVVLDAKQSVGIIDTELKRHGVLAPLEVFAVLETQAGSRLKTERDAHGRRRVQTNVGKLPEDMNPALPKAMAAWEHHCAKPEEVLSCKAYQRSPEATGKSGYFLPFETRRVITSSPETAVKMLSDNLKGLEADDQLARQLDRFEQDYGHTVSYQRATDKPSLNEILKPGIRICFTGSAVYNGRSYGREDMHRIAEENGYTIAKNVSKTRCDLLIAADVASQSGKAKKAREWGKPIYSVQDFLVATGG